MKHFVNNSSVNFILIGALLFGLNEFIQARNTPQALNTIIINQRYIDSLFDQSKSKPTPIALSDSKSELIQKEIEQEVLYREALNLQLDKGDQIIRRHLIQKMDFVLNSRSQSASPPTEREQTQWWQQHQERYRAPYRFSFYHVYLRPENVSASDALSIQLHSGSIGEIQHDSQPISPSDAYQLGDPFLNGHYFQQKTRSQINNLLGDKLTEHILTTELHQWYGPITSPYGHHWVYLEEKHNEETLPFKIVKKEVYQDLQEHKLAIEKRVQLNTLISSYHVTIQE